MATPRTRTRRLSSADRPTGLVGQPTSRPGLLYRAIRLLCAAVGRLLFRVEVAGLENLPRTADGRPAGGWICCGLPHRTWAEPFVLFSTLRAEPRIVMLGEGPTIFGSRLRAFLVRRVGGVIPIWPGSGASGFAAVATAVEQVIGAGAVFAIFPERGRPARAPAFRRVSSGVVRLAQRSGAPMVLIVFGGTHDLYLRRRMVIRILPPVGPPPPEADARAIAAHMADLLTEAQRAASDAHHAAESAPPRRKRWRWLQGPFPRTG